MWHEFDGMRSIHLQSASSIQHLCTPPSSLTLIRHPLVIPCCVVLCLASFLSAFSPEHICSFIPSKAVLKMHISCDITACDFHPPLWYHCRPYDSLYFHSFPYFLHLICESDSVIYNPLARNLQIGRIVVEIISSLAMVCGEWLGVHVYGFICETSSAVSTEKALTSQWKWVEGGRMQRMGQRCGMGEKIDELRRWKKKKDREWPPMVNGENKTDRERWWWVVLMMRGCTQFSEEAQPWAPPAGHIFAAVSLVWPATPQRRNIGDMCEPAACLPAEGVISASGWGAKVSSVWWEGKWASQSWRKSLHPDKWSTSPFTVSYYVVWHYPSPAFSINSNTKHQWQHIEWFRYVLSSDIYIVSLL